MSAAREKRIATVKDLLVKEPKDVFLNYALGLEYSAEPQTYPEALAQFEKVIEIDPQYLAAYYQAGNLLASVGRKQEALQMLRVGFGLATSLRDLKTAGEFSEAIFMLED